MKYSTLKMKNFTLSILTILVTSVTLFAQTSQDAQRSQADETLVRSVGGVVPIRPKSVVSGTPYLSDEFRLGRVLFANSQSEVIQMDYNVHANQLHYMQNGQLLALNFNQIEGFVFLEPTTQNVIQEFRTGEVDPDLEITQNTPLKVIYDGEVKLYEHHKAYINEIKNSYTGINTRKYVNKSYIVFKDLDGEMKRIKLKKKDFLKKVIDKKYKKRMDKFVKQNKLKMKSEEDAKLFLAQYETLLEENS